MILAVGIAVVAITYWRIWYGVDLTDESFYVVEPYRFVIGARPFVDETSVTQQTTALLVYPFVRAYYAFEGVTGVVLFVRHLQFLLSLLVGWAVFSSLRVFLERSCALLIALAAVVFVPFTVHSLSYDSVGSSLFTVGCLLGVRSLVDRRPRRSAALAGACLGLAAFAYLPLVVPVAVCVAVRAALARRGRVGGGVPHALLALGLPAVGMAAVVATAGFSTVVDDYRRSSRFLGQAGGLHKLHLIASHEWTTLPLWYALLPALVLLVILWRVRPVLALPLLAALPFLARPPKVVDFAASLEYVAHFGWLALPLFLLVRRRHGATLLLLGVWLPALVAGLMTAYSSANGGVNFGVGFFPAAIVAAVFLVFAFEDALVGAGRAELRWLAVIPAAGVLALLVVADTLPVYRDGTLSKLTARVTTGPYAGLETTPWKLGWLGRLRSDLASVGPNCTISFFNDFPAGYLLTEARPDTNDAWVATVARSLVRTYQDELIGYFRRHSYPDVAVVVRRIPYTRNSGRSNYYWGNEPLVNVLRPPAYRLVRYRRGYSIFERSGTPCALKTLHD